MGERSSLFRNLYFQEHRQSEMYTSHQSHVVSAITRNLKLNEWGKCIIFIKIRVARTSAQKRAVPKSMSAGLSDIVLELNATKRGIRSTNAGSSFLSMAEEEGRRKVFAVVVLSWVYSNILSLMLFLFLTIF